MRIPTHRPYLKEPHTGRTIVFETVPAGRARGVRGYCKYCYRTHSQWWAMPSAAVQLKQCNPERYGSLPDAEIEACYGAKDPDGVPSRELLCGWCEHVSLECFI